MGRIRGAKRTWWQCIFTSKTSDGGQRRRRRQRNRHPNQPAYWQGLAALEPRLMMSITANIIDPPAPLVIDEASSVIFAGETTGAPATPTWDVSPVHNATSTTERMVRIDGDRVVWSSGFSSTANEAVWFRDGDNAPINLSGHLNAGATEPVIWENYVAFSTSGSIYLYDINDPTTVVDPVTNATIPKLKQVATGSHLTNLEIDAGRIVFQSASTNAIQMYTIATAQLTIISEAGFPVESHPDISGGKVVWQGFNSANGTNDIFLYDIASAQTKNLSILAGGDDGAFAPQIAAGRVIWSTDQGAIYYYDGATTQKVSSDSVANNHPVISEDRAAWWSTGTIWALDVTQPVSPTNQAVQLVTGLTFVQDPQVDGRNIVWSSNVSGSREVFLYDGDAAIPGAPVKISTQTNSGSVEDAFPVISGRDVAWVGGDVYFARATGTTITWDIDGQVFATDTLAPALTFADDGVHTVTLTISDGVTSATDSVTITVNNLAPTVQISGGPAGDVNEGEVVSFAISATDPAGAADPLSYSWTVLKNGSAYASGLGTNVSFTPDDNGTYVLEAAADDGDGGVATATQVVNAINVAPRIDSLNVAAQAVRGQDVTVSASLSDPGAADTRTAAWQVLDSANVLVASGTGDTFTFAAPDLGIYTIQLTVTDDDAGSVTQSAVLDIVVAAVADDLVNDGHALLTIGGTEGGDHLHVRERNGLFEVFFGSQFHGSFALTAGDRIQVLGGSGNDWIRVDSPAGIATEVSGGAGDDWIRTGDGDDIILGGDGNDLIFGNGGRDLLIGEAGGDLILGNGEDDILIGGYYSQSVEREALFAISAAWSSPTSYAERIGVITSGVGPGGTTAGVYRLDTATLLDDGTTDILLGLQGADWFAAHSDNDLTDSRTYEMLTDTQYSFVTAL